MCTLRYLNGSFIQQWGPVVARVFLAALFIIIGVTKLFSFSMIVAYIASAGLPMPTLLAVLSTALELIAGSMLLLGFYGRYAAEALFAFTLLATLIFHNNLSDQLQFTMALKNVSIMGGLLLIMVHGTGALSMKREGDTVISV